MKSLARIAMILLAVAATADARAQRISGHRVGENGIGSATGCSFADTDGTVVLCSQATPLPTAGFRETFQIASANAASAPVTVYGGDYILAQVCTGYGTLALQVLGPGGSTWLTAASYAAADTANGHGATFGSNAKVRVLLTSTTGCNATLSRVP